MLRALTLQAVGRLWSRERACALTVLVCLATAALQGCISWWRGPAHPPLTVGQLAQLEVLRRRISVPYDPEAPQHQVSPHSACETCVSDHRRSRQRLSCAVPQVLQGKVGTVRP